MTQEFHLSVTPVGEDEYLVRTERVAPGVPLAEEQVTWPVEDWLLQARQLMNDPLLGLLQGDVVQPLFSEQAHPGSLWGRGTPLPAQPASNLVAFGQQLYNALFQGTIRDSWMSAQGVAQNRREVLRLRLGLKGTRLPRLPWEVLHAGDRPVATGLDIVFSRYQPTFTPLMSSLQFQEPSKLEQNQPLKILMAIAAPSDQESLELKREAIHLQEELQRRLRSGTDSGDRSPDIQLTILEQPDREQLTQALEQGEYEVLHYAGHSSLGAAGGDLYLVSGRTGLTETLSGDDLAGLLVNNGIRMAVFNSCRGAYTAMSDPLTDTGERNLAEALVKRGIPGVLAMAERIPDDVALTLSRLFYRNLKQGYSVDLSLSRARQGLISAYSSHQLYWALPILYLHPEFDGCLIGGNNPDNLAPGLVLPQMFEPPLGTGGEAELSAQTHSSNSLLNSEAALEAFSEAEIYEFEEEFSEVDFPDDLGDYADYTYAEDEAVIADILSQLTSDTAEEEEEELLIPDSSAEILLPEAETKSGSYLNWPENLLYRDAALPEANEQATTAQPGQTVSRNSQAKANSELTSPRTQPSKLTTAIATYRQAIQQNPHDVAAYNNLGVALAKQGNLTEAIAAYNKAIEINPKLADTYNNLGVALFQQQRPDEAIAAYHKAIEIDADLPEVYSNLGVALRQQSGQAEVKSTAAQATRPVPVKLDKPSLTFVKSGWRSFSNWLQRPHRPVILSILGVTGVAAVLGVWLLPGRINRSPDPIVSIPAVPTPADVKKANTATATAIATQAFNQKKLAAGQQAVEALLNRGALQEAKQALDAVPTDQIDDPAISFLRGRLTWQFIQAGNKDYSVDDARRYWEMAVRKRSNSPLYFNALGFAYYTEGKLDQANQAWLKTLYLLEEQQSTQAKQQTTDVKAGAPPSSTTTAVNPDSALTAYAGLGLALMKSAENQPPEQRDDRLSKASKLYQKVITDAPSQFQPEALGKNWMWSEQAVADWRSLSKLQAQ